MQRWEGRVLQRLAWRLGLLVGALVYFFGWFAPAVDAAYIHDVRTPVTATLPFDCGGYNLGHLSCNADWCLDGEVHHGWLARKHTGTVG